LARRGAVRLGSLAAAKQEEHYKKLGLIKCSEVSDRFDTEPESEAPETKDQSIVMAEISYPVDSDGGYVGYISEEQMAVLVPILSEGLQREIFAPSRFPQLLNRELPSHKEASPVEHEKLPDAMWPFGRWWPR